MSDSQRPQVPPHIPDAPNALLVGCGDIGVRLGSALALDGWRVTGLRRSGTLPVGFGALAADISERRSVEAALRTPEHPWRMVVFMPTADEFSETAYRRTYVDGIAHVIDSLLAWPAHPECVLMLSSTSVYGQGDGVWLDEDSPAEAEHFAGQQMLAAERRLRDSGLAHCIVRSSGIYGPGRGGMVDRLLSGQRSRHAESLYGNRIHSDDLAGFLAHLMHWARLGAPLQETYLAVDDRPVLLIETETWLAGALGLDYATLAERPARRGGNKRCRNRRLRDSGYRLRHPDYRSGYRAYLDALGALDSASDAPGRAGRSTQTR